MNYPYPMERRNGSGLLHSVTSVKTWFVVVLVILRENRAQGVDIFAFVGRKSKVEYGCIFA